VIGFHRSVRQIAASGDVSARVPVKGEDELADLGREINAMLSTIEKQQVAEKVLQQGLEMEIRKRSEYTRELVHELKTPITPIVSSSEILAEGIQQQPYAQLAQNIYRGALDMNDRLDDLVDIARGEVGALKLRNEPLNMVGVIAQMAREMSPLIESRRQSLALDLPPSLPDVIGDEVRMRQVLRNLISNATKYTGESGKITIRAVHADGNVVVQIQDTGRGIPPEQLQRVFEPYAKIADGILDRQTGLGLGLKLSQTLVELHGGRIWVQSTKGKGSIFSFSLPVRPPPAR
jgi:signal transduction histidine kinase